MSQVIAFANNQALSSKDGADTTITTDPVPLNGYDRATAHLLVESIFNPLAGAGNGISYQGQVSNDGVNWLNVTALTDYATATTATPKAITAAVNGAFLRFSYTLKAATSSVAGVTFDLHVLLDHV